MSDDHDFEPAYGLPERLPASERLLWQGSPDWKMIARDALHLRGLSLYFAVLLLWRGANAMSGGSLREALIAVAWLAPLALLALATLSVLAWLTARTSVYTLTDRRVVMRVGIVLTVTFNLPYRMIDAASLHADAEGRGDIAISLAGDGRIAYAHLWPHVRPWQIRRTQPMLRGLPAAREVATILGAALADAAGMARPPLPQAAPVHVPATAPGQRERDSAPEALAA